MGNYKSLLKKVKDLHARETYDAHGLEDSILLE